ncbi:MAG: hypothetical protein LBQ91_05025 [Oscillospiraceae bacterium]|jgi:hypothetical protein|nr:hypothetical protein [Oscillospiraceae bacterium]
MKNKAFKLIFLVLMASALVFSLFALAGSAEQPDAADIADQDTVLASLEEPFITQDGLPTGDLPPLIAIDLPESETPPAPSPSKSLNSAADPLPGGQRLGYNYLVSSGANSARYKEVYKQLLAYCENLISSTASVEYRSDYSSIYKSYGYAENIGVLGSVNFGTGNALSSNDLDLVWELFFLDNPQYFFVAPWFYGRISTTGVSGYTGVTPFIPEEYFSAKQRKDALTNLENRFQEYAAYVKAGNSSESPVVIARLVHDKIIAERDYAYYLSKPDVHHYAHTIAGVIDLNTLGPVCESYSKAYSYFLTRLGVPNTVQVGIGGGGGHAWNTVELGGLSYYVDTTWDDRDVTNTDVGNRRNGISLDFFLVGTSSGWFTSTHTAADLNPNTHQYAGGQQADWYNIVPSNLAGPLYALPAPGYVYLSDALTYSNRAAPQVRLSYSDTDSRPTGSVIHNLGQFSIPEGADPGSVVPYLYRWTDSGYSGTKYTRGTDYTVRPVLYETLPNGYSRYRLWIDGKGGTVRGTDFFFADIKFITPKAFASTGIAGTQGQALGTTTITLTLDNATLKPAGFSNVNAASWFSFAKPGGLCGLTVRATANIGSNTITITVTGTPNTYNAEYFTISVPGQYLADGIAALTPKSGSGAAYIAIGTSANQLLPAVRVLDLSSTNVTDLDFLASYKDLEELYVKGDKLTDISGIIHLKNLRVLSLPNALRSNAEAALWVSLLPPGTTVQWQ